MRLRGLARGREKGAPQNHGQAILHLPQARALEQRTARGRHVQQKVQQCHQAPLWHRRPQEWETKSAAKVGQLVAKPNPARVTNRSAKHGTKLVGNLPCRV